MFCYDCFSGGCQSFFLAGGLTRLVIGEAPASDAGHCAAGGSMLDRVDLLYGKPNGRPAPIIKPPILAQDRVILSPKSAFKKARRVEAGNAAKLRRIAKHIGDIVREFPEGTLQSALFIQTAMERYSQVLKPWAEAVGDRMITEVAARDKDAWRDVSARIGRALHKEIETAPTGKVLRESLARQVDLITSLPREAGERVHKMTVEGMAEGRRTDEIISSIMETGSVSRSRAELIATTEVSRTASELTQARAEHVGCTHYKWRTVSDSAVRPDHKRLNGKTFAWNEPPVSDSRTGERSHPGCIYRCRCYAEPIIG